jgi:type IV pilus assembly protein PilV
VKTNLGRSRRRSRSGFTIVELIVAMLMLTIGLLGLAGVGAVVLKQMKGGTYQTIAASIAQSRFEQLEGDPCASIVGGTATVRGMTEKWNVSAMGLRAKTVYDTVTFVTSSAETEKVGIHTVVACTQ